jgi:basic membrane protein A
MRPRRLALLIVAVLMVACTGPEPSGSGFRVALMTPGPVSDAGWNAAAFDGLEMVRDKLGAGISLVETNSPADFENAMRDYAQRHFNLVFAHGFEYTDAALTVGRSFPSTTFVVTSGAASSRNVASLSFKLEEATWIEGVLAGGMSKTGVVGEIGGVNIPQIAMTFEAFKRGFLSVRPTGKVLLTYTGSFNDVGAAKEAALTQIALGADMLFHDADQAGLGVFQAAVQSHVYAFGIIRDQASVAPATVVASAVADVPLAFLDIARAVKEHEFHPTRIEYGIRDHMVRVVYNQRLKQQIPAGALARAQDVQRDIVNGRMSIDALIKHPDAR